MSYTQQIDDCSNTRIGNRGVSSERMRHWQKRIKQVGKELLLEIHDGTIPLLAPYLPDSDEIYTIQAAAETICNRFKTLVVLGTGGSTLCGQALVNSLHPSEFGPTSVVFWENIDPHTMEHDLAALDLDSTYFLSISKSGSTLETLAQTYVCVENLVNAFGTDSVTNHMCVISDPGDNPIRKLAAKYTIQVLDHEPDIGGRFAIFTNVGLLPAAVAGLDIEQIVKGAHIIIKEFAEKPKKSRPGISATLHLALQENGIRSTTLMTYIDRLHALTRWFCQLHAESLGKHKSATVPIAARGTIDQHSQLQLYLEGPNDKYYTLLLADRYRKGNTISPTILAQDHEEILANHTIGDVISVSQEGTRESLIYHKRPVRTIRLDAITCRTIGELAMHIILETILIARVQGFDPFGQPAVEDGKARTREKLAAL